MKILFCFLLPSIIPVYLWGEKGTVAFFSQAVIRYLFGLNFTWLVNSAAHMWGYKPYDKYVFWSRFKQLWIFLIIHIPFLFQEH